MKLSWLSDKANGKKSDILQTGVLFQFVALDELYLFLTVVLMVLSHVVAFFSSSETECSSYMMVIQARRFLGFHTSLKKTSQSDPCVFKYFCRRTIVWIRIKNKWFFEYIF